MGEREKETERTAFTCARRGRQMKSIKMLGAQLLDDDAGEKKQKKKKGDDE